MSKAKQSIGVFETLALVFALLASSAWLPVFGASDDSGELPPEPINKIVMDQIDVHTVLSYYKRYSGRELAVSKDIERVSKFIAIRTNGSFTHSGVADVLANALEKQVGVMIVPLDSNRASVTFNEALAPPDAVTGVQLNATSDDDDWISLLAVVAIFGIAVGLFLFWIWMIIDCARFENEGGMKVGWLLALVFGGFVSAPVYLIVRKIPRKVVVT